MDDLYDDQTPPHAPAIAGNVQEVIVPVQEPAPAPEPAPEPEPAAPAPAPEPEPASGDETHDG